MTDEIKTGGPAFPFVPGEGSALYESEGMQLRDYFAAKAMAALIHRYADVNIDAPGVMEEIAIRASKMADAMIKARG
ncbi:TPA: hypothetical protein ACQQX6_004293 [Yersinia enterocolitica]|uniref:hypothetical protein n=1 Tax=Yersinia enterocolitica TaxID=630 RepID=UPI0028A478F9|nr:hypothetical protein [Yersinia enterocolitica]EKN6209117.1 hypothetical protein [Yersinia enterocolitica]ELZ4048434.1 hypothetical protein [Yersinia enterocolitica]HDL6523815.1 hypothetical protein [Yersinia enterocolitica]HDL7319984.1 hypothetical protein [Yersinia enterocolitica]